MARTLSKVHKKISKKRNGKTTNLHENSRDAQRLRAAGAREETLHRMMDAAKKQNQVYGTTFSGLTISSVANDRSLVNRIAWFKSALEGSVGAVSDEEMRLLTQRFVLTVVRPPWY